MKRIGIVLVLLLCMSAMVFAQDGETRTQMIFIGIDPISAVFTVIQAEASVPLMGWLELGAQASYWNVDWISGIFGQSSNTGAFLLQATAIIRMFPSQTADGFFFSGRVTYLMAGFQGYSGTFSDIAAGIDLGWRWRWWLDNFGIIFQIYGGMERALTQQDIGQVFPIIPVGGMHLGLCF